MPDRNIFAYMWDLGYQRLCSVVPPGAPLHPESRLAKRAATPDKDPRGKAPGRRGPDGLWSGYNFVTHEPTRAEIGTWALWGASVGMKMGHGLVAIDVDVPDPETAAQIANILAEALGVTSMRVGNAPKFLLLFRITENVPYAKLRLALGHVELITEGKQFVAFGIHPRTGKPYEWPVPLVARDALVLLTSEKLHDALNRVAEELGGDVTVSGEIGDAPAQDTLRAPLGVVQSAVNHLPNHDADFPSREDFNRVGYAIKAAAGPEHEAEALDCFQQWAARWDAGYNDPAEVEEEWARMKPPFRIGADWLFHHAERLGGWTGRATLYFEPVAAVAAEKRGDLVAGDVAWSDLDHIPPRRWLYGRKLIRGYVTILGSPGGVGKTAWTIGMTLACASGQMLLHDRPIRPLRVWLYNLEDPREEMMRRLKAALLSYDLPRSTLDNVKVSSGRDRRLRMARANRLGEPEKHVDADLLVAEMLRQRIDLLVVDPYVLSHSLPENSNEAQAFLLELFGAVATAADAAVLLVHHFRKGGQGGDADSFRGGSAQIGGARQAFTLTAMTPEEAALAGVPESQRTLHLRMDDAKRNMSPPLDRVEWTRLANFRLGNGDADYPLGDEVQVAEPFRLPEPFDGVEDAQREEMLDDIEAGPGEGKRYSTRPQDTGRFVGALLVEKYERTPAQAKEIVRGWIKENLVEEREYSDAHRNKRKGLFVNGVVRAGREPVARLDVFA